MTNHAALLSSLLVLASLPAAAQDGVADEPRPIPAVAQDAVADDPRPEGTTIGIGVGWAFPQSLLEPNTVSARVRFGRIAIEPNVILGGSSSGTASNTSVTLGEEPAVTTEDEDRNRGLNFSAGANVRYTFASRGPLDLIGLGGVGLGWTSSTADNDVLTPDTLNRVRTNGFNVGLSWGVGIEWFVREGLSISADAQNPLISWSTLTTVTDTERMVGDQKQTSRVESVEKGFQYGLRFQPSARVTVHLYF